MAVDATNPNLAPSDLGTRRFDMFDTLLSLRDADAVALSASNAENGIQIEAEKICYYKAVIQHDAIGGTVDGSNFWTVTVETSDNNSDWVVIRSIQLAADAQRYDVAIEGAEVEALMEAAGENEALWIRVNAALTGTTAGDLDYTAFLTA